MSKCSPKDTIKIAKDFGIEYLVIPQDRLMKSSFHKSKGRTTALFLKTISSIVSRTDQINNNISHSKLKNLPLSDYKIKKIIPTEETVSNPKFNIKRDHTKNKKSNNCKKNSKTETKSTNNRQLPKEPKGDLPFILELTNASHSLKAKCKHQIEVQQYNSNPIIWARILQYAYEFHTKNDVYKNLIEKTYCTALCFWETNSGKLASNFVLNKDFLSKGIPSSETLPICCTGIFLGGIVKSYEIIIQYISQNLSKANLKQVFQKKFEEATKELKQRYNNFFSCDIDSLYKKIKSFIRKEKPENKSGCRPNDFNSNVAIKKAFEYVEQFELLQSFIVSSVATKENVKKLLSKTVKELYMNNTINKCDINSEETERLWYAQQVERAQQRAEIAKLTLKVSSALYEASDNKIEINQFSQIINPDQLLRGKNLSKRKTEILTYLNQNLNNRKVIEKGNFLCLERA